MADDHAGLRAALREVLAEAAYQRCYVHFLRNALDHVPRRVDDDCLRRSRLIGQLPGRKKLKTGSRLLVSRFPEIKFILSCCGVL